MTAHHTRAHAPWSASSTAANWACPGRLPLVDVLALPDNESEAAAWGTACHEISEKTLQSLACDAGAFLGQKIKTKEHEIEVDDEMVETAQMYVDYVRSRMSVRSRLMIEQRFDLALLDPPYESGGTADAVIWRPDDNELEVVDLKGGRGVVVEAKGNPQLRTYALGALLANNDLGAKRIRVTIVQPRAGHKDGRIRSDPFHVADLVEWTADLLAAMRRAKEAEAAMAEMPRAEWEARYLSAGSHCTFCQVAEAAACSALERQALDAAGVWFDDQDRPRLANAPDTLSPAELAKRLDAADMIEEWLSAIRAFAHAQAENGVEIPNYGLVEKVGRRSWACSDEEKVARDLVAVAGLTFDQVYDRKLRSPAQIEKLGKETKQKIANMWHQPVRGTNLVRLDKTSRAPAVPAAQRFFNSEDK